MTNDELMQEFEEHCENVFNMRARRSQQDSSRYDTTLAQYAWAGYQAGYAKGKEQPCPYVVSSSEGTSYCALAEKSQGEIARDKALLRECYTSLASAISATHEALADNEHSRNKSTLEKLKQAGYK